MGRIRTAYNWVAAVALLHVLALGVGAGYLFGTGMVDPQRVRDAVTVLSGEVEESAESVKPEGEATAAQKVASRRLGAINDEIDRRNAERYRSQIEQRLKMVNAARLEVDRRREEIEKQAERDSEARKQRDERESGAGFAKEVEIIGSLSPKTALAQIMTMNDADAARLMFQLDTRKVKKIIEAAKTEATRAKITAIRRLIRDMKTSGIESGTDAKG